MVPLYEAKMIHHYDTRWATYEPDGETRYMTEAEKAEGLAPMPRYWVAAAEVDRKLNGKWDKTWFLGWRDVCRSTDERTFITTLLPRIGYGHKILIGLPTNGHREGLQGAWSSFVFDYVARQKLGGTSMAYFTTMQLPVPQPAAHLTNVDSEWVGERVSRLDTWIANPVERSEVRAELDAYYFHLYGLTRDEAHYVMETFPIVRRKDEAEYGTYRTKDLILAAYDELAAQR